MKTTLNAIRKHHPCEGGWRKLLRHLGKTAPDDEPLPITTILDSNGLDDALWCLRATTEPCDRVTRLLAVAFAREVQHLMTDPRSLAALDVAERYAHGRATDAELGAARAAAWGAARAAAWGAAWGAAWSAAEDAARAAAGGAARAAAWDAARAAAWDAAWGAARAAAWDAAWSAARAAAWDAAWSAAEDAMRVRQAQIMREMLEAK